MRQYLPMLLAALVLASAGLVRTERPEEIQAPLTIEAPASPDEIQAPRTVHSG
jgi:hypothetical protein